MVRIRVCRNEEECAVLWKDHITARHLFDLWPVRQAFATAYKRKPYFLLAEENEKVVGLLPLAEIEQSGTYGFYPAETWQGRTWLEQNRICSQNRDVLDQLLEALPGPTHLRYMHSDAVAIFGRPLVVDEVGYFFFPPETSYSYDAYLGRFSGKSRKALRREVEGLCKYGFKLRYDCLGDLGTLFRMNQERFGESSYFSDCRFIAAFESMARWLTENGLLRLTTIVLGGKVAAVDIGAVWKKQYTLLAGATSQDFPGVAKLINLHHIQRACEERMQSVDFLCGDFSWKKRFHLTERPLFELVVDHDRERQTTDRKEAVLASSA